MHLGLVSFRLFLLSSLQRSGLLPDLVEEFYQILWVILVVRLRSVSVQQLLPHYYNVWCQTLHVYTMKLVFFNLKDFIFIFSSVIQIEKRLTAFFFYLHD